MANKRLMLDAGHGANTAGRRTIPNGITEWRLNQNVANFVVEMLRDYNVDIRFSNDTTGATDVALGTRVTRTRDFNPHLFISIHHNAFNGVLGTHTGTEVFIHPNASAQSRNIANLIAPRLAANTGLRNRGVKTTAWAVLGLPANIPAILVEGGFMDSRIDVPVIESTAGQRAYAKAITDSVIEFLGLKKSGNSSNNNGGKTHTVKAGETLTSIAKQYNTTVNAIAQANNITNVNVIHTGRVLTIPTNVSGGSSNSNSNNNSTPSAPSVPNTSRDVGLVDWMKAQNMDSSFANRAKLAQANGINNYTGTAAQNTQLLSILRGQASTPAPTQSFFPATRTTGSGLVDTLNSIKVDSSFAYRQRIATANGISNYSGTAAQNNQLLSLLNSGRLVRP